MRSLDGSAILAVIRGEAGADRIAQHPRGGLLSTANYAEVIGVLLRGGSKIDAVRVLMEKLPIQPVALDQGLAFRAGELEAKTRRAGLPFGDRACLAVAERFGVPALTGDRAWLKVGQELKIEVELFR